MAAPPPARKSHGNYEHWLLAYLLPGELTKLGVRFATPPTWLSHQRCRLGGQRRQGSFPPARLRRLSPFRRLRQEPEDLISVAQQIKQSTKRKKTTSSKLATLMKQRTRPRATTRQRLNDRAVASRLPTASSTSASYSSTAPPEPLADMKKVGPISRTSASSSQELDSCWLKKPERLRAINQNAEFRLN